MKLNYDCVRDVMLYLEENLCFKEFLLSSDINLNYTQEDIDYSIIKLEEANFIIIQDESTLENTEIYIHDITFYGHKFIGEIQSDTIWDKTKSVSKDLGIQTINGITQIASSVISSLILSKLG